MSFEKFNQEEVPAENETKERKRKHSPKRLMLAVEAHLIPFLSNIKVLGKEHLKEIPPDKKVVFAVTHLSDLDIALAIRTLGNDFDLGISNVSYHHNFFEDPSGNMAITIGGKENFFPIDYAPGSKAKPFNPDNFEPMAEAMEKGKEMIVAAHNPAKGNKLTKGGVGAVYLAQLADAVVLPVAIDTKSEHPQLFGENTWKNIKERPNVDVKIGEPINFEHIEGIERFKEIFDKRERKEKLTPEDIAEFSTLSAALKTESEQVMESLASMLPEEKRGPYAEKKVDSPKPER